MNTRKVLRFIPAAFGKAWKSLCSQFHGLICGGVTAFLSDDQREKILICMVSHCYSVLEKIHGVELEDDLADADEEHEEED